MRRVETIALGERTLSRRDPVMAGRRLWRPGRLRDRVRAALRTHAEGARSPRRRLPPVPKRRGVVLLGGRAPGPRRHAHPGWVERRLLPVCGGKGKAYRTCQE